MMDDLNKVIGLVMECGMVGAQLTLNIDTDFIPAWGMYIKTDGGTEYHLSTNDNGGYLLQAQVPVPQALISSGPQGVVGITRDPESGICQIYMPTLNKETLSRSLQGLRIALNRLRSMNSPPTMNHNLN